MKDNRILLFVVALTFSVAYSRSVFETEVINDDTGIVRSQDEIERREYYWLVSSWSPCKCNGDMGTGIQYRVVMCTRKPCHFIRAPRPSQVCECR